MRSYQYEHREGVHPISWEEFATLSGRVAEALAGHGIEAVVGIARAGLFPATAIACTLRCELYPARVTRRVMDQVTQGTPVWRVPVSHDVVGKVVAVVDEIADTGETLRMVAQRVRDLGATRVVTACLVHHSWANPVPDVAALVTDALVIFPWDREDFMDGRWQPHPETVAALKAQGKQ